MVNKAFGGAETGGLVIYFALKANGSQGTISDCPSKPQGLEV